MRTEVEIQRQHDATAHETHETCCCISRWRWSSGVFASKESIEVCMFKKIACPNGVRFMKRSRDEGREH